MTNTKKLIREDLKKLFDTGEYILYSEALKNNKLTEDEIEALEKIEDFKIFKKNNLNIKTTYQKWYSVSCNVISQLISHRLEEFKLVYINPKRKNGNIDFISYTISDYLQGSVIFKNGIKSFDIFDSFAAKLMLQISILQSCEAILDSKLSDLEGFLQSELFDSELDTAKDLLKKKHIRLAGALAGITLEVHLKKICKNHSITLRKANPTISDCNEALKNEEVIDIVTWRLIQRLGDIRNLSVHAKDREPTESEVQDLIIGCQKLIAELF